MRQECFDVFLDGTAKRLYNDHVVGTPPLVVQPASSEPRREASSFLSLFPAIIPIATPSVNLGSLLHVPTVKFPVINEPGHKPASRSAPTDPDHPTWPGLARFPSTNVAYDSLGMCLLDRIGRIA